MHRRGHAKIRERRERNQISKDGTKLQTSVKIHTFSYTAI